MKDIIEIDHKIDKIEIDHRKVNDGHRSPMSSIASLLSSPCCFSFLASTKYKSEVQTLSIIEV